MRILFLLHAHPELQAGGTEMFSRDLFRALRDGGGVNGVFLAGTAAHQRPQSPGTAFQTVGQEADELLLWSGGFDPFFLSQIDLHGVVPAFSGLLAELRPQIVHVHHLLTLGAEMLGLVRRIVPRARIVMTLHDFYPICAHDGQMVTTAGGLCRVAAPDACRRCFPDRELTDFRLRRLHVDAALGLVDHFIAPSHFLRERYIAWGLAPERISVVANGIPDLLAAPLRSGEGPRNRFAFFGHINRFKGAPVALAASAALSRLGVAHTLSLHGGTDHQTPETIARFEAALGDAPAARYRGAYRRADLAELMAAVDWVLFPSEWWENAPLIISEAFQHRRPVICSGLGGAAEQVRDGIDGLHFPVGEALLLAQAMRRGIEEPGLWDRLCQGIAPPVTITESARQHRALYDRLLARPAAGSRREAA